MTEVQEWPPYDVQQSLQRLDDLECLVRSLLEQQGSCNEDIISKILQSFLSFVAQAT